MPGVEEESKTGKEDRYDVSKVWKTVDLYTEWPGRASMTR